MATPETADDEPFEPTEGATLITAAELKKGMTWVGTMPIKVWEVTEGETEDCWPWNMGREKRGKPVPMTMVRVTGTQIRGLGDTYTGTWVLQPDTPIEVSRAQDD